MNRMLCLLTHLLWDLTNIRISGLYDACIKYFNLILNVVINTTSQLENTLNLSNQNATLETIILNEEQVYTAPGYSQTPYLLLGGTVRKYSCA